MKEIILINKNLKSNILDLLKEYQNFNVTQVCSFDNINYLTTNADIIILESKHIQNLVPQCFTYIIPLLIIKVDDFNEDDLKNQFLFDIIEEPIDKKQLDYKLNMLTKLGNICKTSSSGYLCKLLCNSSLCVIITDLNHSIKSCNNQFCNFLGYNKKELIGHMLLEFMTEESKRYLSKSVRVNGRDYYELYLNLIKKDTKVVCTKFMYSIGSSMLLAICSPQLELKEFPTQTGGDLIDYYKDVIKQDRLKIESIRNNLVNIC